MVAGSMLGILVLLLSFVLLEIGPESSSLFPSNVPPPFVECTLDLGTLRGSPPIPTLPLVEEVICLDADKVSLSNVTST